MELKFVSLKPQTGFSKFSGFFFSSLKSGVSFSTRCDSAEIHDLRGEVSRSCGSVGTDGIRWSLWPLQVLDELKPLTKASQQVTQKD